MAASKAHPEVSGPWLDLSTGINPEPYPALGASQAALGRLPDPLELEQVEQVAASAFGARPGRVAAVSGAETAIRLLPTILGKVTVDIVGPTYGAHAESWQSALVAPHLISAEQAQTSGADVLVIVNPNNPDGHLFSAADLKAILKRREAVGQWLVVDESFGECAPLESLAAVHSHRLIVLRSFGKFYGLAGVRLGFAIASPRFKTLLRALTGDWPVSADAITMGRQAYSDTAWIERTRAALEVRAGRLDGLLVQSGFEILGGTSLFRLVRHPEAEAWFQHLCRQGILTRPFDHSPGVLRFGVPKDGEFQRLEQALEAGPWA